MKQFNSHKDIVVKWNDKRSKWQINLTALGCVPARPVFDSKADATQAARQAFEAFQSDGLDVMGVAPKTDLLVGELLDLYQDKQLERARDVDEKYSTASYAN